MNENLLNIASRADHIFAALLTAGGKFTIY